MKQPPIHNDFVADGCEQFTNLPQLEIERLGSVIKLDGVPGVHLDEEEWRLVNNEIRRLRLALKKESEHLEKMTYAANGMHAEMRNSHDAIDWLICNADDQPEWVREWVRDGFSQFPSK